MLKGLRSIIVFTGISTILNTVPVNAQILQDTIALNLVTKDIDYIYSLQFNDAREVYTRITKLYPDHPIVFLLKGIMTYWENYPLLRTSSSHTAFEDDMHQCIRLSEMNTNSGHEAEYLLADLCASGMLLMYYDDNDLIMEVLHLTRNTYTQLRHAFDLTAECTDLYYFTGLYNYYREGYQRIFPAYRPILHLFPAGDMALGVKELQTSAIHSVVLSPESYSLLSSIYLNYENKFSESLFYCRTLHDRYPANEFYLINYIKNLLLLKQYGDAEKLLKTSSENVGNKYFQAQLEILQGILLEKQYYDFKQAQEYYDQGIRDISTFGKYGNEFAAYAYFGLSRISESDIDKNKSITYRKEALKLATFKKINFDN